LSKVTAKVAGGLLHLSPEKNFGMKKSVGWWC
jgi:hypothetical protein